MASFCEYRKTASECARLAQAAPSQRGRVTFSAAAKHWTMLARLAEKNSTHPESSAVDWALWGHREPKASDLSATVER
jgi:hypothetical protein